MKVTYRGLVLEGLLLLVLMLYELVQDHLDDTQKTAVATFIQHVDDPYGFKE
jgi:hypothetical protein